MGQAVQHSDAVHSAPVVTIQTVSDTDEADGGRWSGRGGEDYGNGTDAFGRRSKLNAFVAGRMASLSMTVEETARQQVGRSQARMRQESTSLESRLQMLIDTEKERKNEEKRQAERERKEKELARKKVPGCHRQLCCSCACD